MRAALGVFVGAGVLVAGKVVFEKVSGATSEAGCGWDCGGGTSRAGLLERLSVIVDTLSGIIDWRESGLTKDQMMRAEIKIAIMATEKAFNVIILCYCQINVRNSLAVLAASNICTPCALVETRTTDTCHV